MTKPPKVPRPPKPPITPAPAQTRFIEIAMHTERDIGRVSVAWGKLEGLLDEGIWWLLGLKIELGRIVTKRLDATAKIKTMRELGEASLEETLYHKLSPLLDHIDILRDDRNLVIHGIWGRNVYGIPIALSIRPKAESGTRVIGETFPDNRLQKLASDIQDRRLELLRLLKSLGALRDTPEPPPPAE